jgi:hypothetical protein
MGGKVKEGLGFEGIKGGKREKEGAFAFGGFWLRLHCESREETDWFTSRSWEASAFLVRGSSAFEAS